MPDDDIRDDIVHARRGDRSALDRVLTALSARIRGAAANRLRGPLRAKMAASDLLQSTYVDVVRSIGEFRGDDPESFAAWVIRILENNLRDRLRFYGRQRRTGEEQQADTADTPGPGPTPSVEVMQVEHLAAVGKALAELPDDQRRVLQLRVFEGRDYDEVAAAMGRSPGALRMLLSRARATLTLRLDQLLDES